MEIKRGSNSPHYPDHYGRALFQDPDIMCPRCAMFFAVSREKLFCPERGICHVCQGVLMCGGAEEIQMSVEILAEELNLLPLEIATLLENKARDIREKNNGTN